MRLRADEESLFNLSQYDIHISIVFDMFKSN